MSKIVSAKDSFPQKYTLEGNEGFSAEFNRFFATFSAIFCISLSQTYSILRVMKH